jgi:hypothetical protein
VSYGRIAGTSLQHTHVGNQQTLAIGSHDHKSWFSSAAFRPPYDLETVRIRPAPSQSEREYLSICDFVGHVEDG